MSDRLAVCIPTYNERENIPGLVREIFTYVPNATVIIADDNSPDQTGAAVRMLQETYPRLILLNRTKDRGFANSYKDAFTYCLDNDFEWILQMDADFSHHPRFIPELLLKRGKADFVVGSRYAPGGKIENWPLFRRILSKGGNFYVSTLLGRRVSDMTGGFNLWNRKVLKAVPYLDLKSDGYSFLIEIKYWALEKGFIPAEAPITFADRTAAASKMSPSIMREAVMRVPQIALAPMPASVSPRRLMNGTTVILPPMREDRAVGNY